MGALQFLCFVTQHSQHDVDCMINLLRSKAAGPDGKKIKSRVAMDQSPVVVAFGSLLYMQRLPSSNSNHSSYSNHSAESCLASLLPPRSTDSAASPAGRPRLSLPAMSAAFKAFLNSPVGPKTTHFWGPVSNWGIILASVADTKKPPEMISGNMTGVLCVYSALFVRFAWMVRPRNYFLMVTHSCNECVQLYQLSRWARAQGFMEKKELGGPTIKTDPKP